jgi:hypothetical protein
MLLFAAAETHLSRLAAWVADTFPEVNCKILNDQGALVASCAEDNLEKDSVLIRVVSSAFQLPYVDRVIDEALIVDDSVSFTLIDGRCDDTELRSVLERCKWNADGVYRANVWPHAQLMTIGTSLASLGVHFHPKRYESVVSVVCLPSATVDNAVVCHVSIRRRDDMPPRPSHAVPELSLDSKVDVLCRAHHKIDEIFSRFSAWIPDRLASGTAVDVGAAPGGWSLYLSQKSKLVYAIDPAELAPSVAFTPNIIHARRRLVTARDTPEGSACRVMELDGPFSEVSPFISVLACDAVFEPAFGAELLLEFLPYLLPGALLIFTVKFRTRSVAGQECAAIEVMERLRPRFKEMQIAWLFANKRERTIVAVF